MTQPVNKAPAWTAGPWAVHPQHACVVPAQHVMRPIGGAEDLALDLRVYAQEICALHWPDRHRSEVECRANANLIAAATDLYEALEGMLTEWDRLTQYGSPLAQAANERVIFARSAVALARGEQP